MSDYTPVNDFSAKDLLSPGDAQKKILGADMDAETAAIQTAVNSKYDDTDLADQSTAEALTSNTTLMTPLRVANVLNDNAGALGDLQALADPGADRLVFWDDSASAAVFATLGDGLTFSATTLRLDFSPLSAIGTVDGANDLLVIEDATDGSIKKISVDDAFAGAGGSVPDSRTLTAGAGLTGGGDLSANRSFAVDIAGTTAETSVEDADSILIHDDSAGALREMTRANFLAGVGGMTVVNKTTSTARSSTTTPTIDPDLQFPVTAGSRYVFFGQFQWNQDSTQTQGLQWLLNSSAGTASTIGQWLLQDDSSTLDGNTDFRAAYVGADYRLNVTVDWVPGTNGDLMVSFSGELHQLSADGNFGLFWAQSVSSANDTDVDRGFIAYQEI